MSPRERDVVRLLALGMTMKQVGARLQISWRTAQKHAERARKKIRAGGWVCENHGDLLSFALKSRLVTMKLLVAQVRYHTSVTL